MRRSPTQTDSAKKHPLRELPVEAAKSKKIGNWAFQEVKKSKKSISADQSPRIFEKNIGQNLVAGVPERS